MPSRAQERKCYEQACPMATALDIVGDRWTILILRELLGGPARFHELYDGLPGIARNLLTDRLRRLEGDAIVRRVSAHNATLYALTDLGATIRPALEELGLWGARLRRVAPARHGRSIRAIAMALQAILVRAGDALPVDPSVIELEVGGEHIEIHLGPRPTVTARPSTDADTRMRASRAAVSDFLSGRSFAESRFAYVSGDAAARAALLRALDAVGIAP